MTNRKWIIGCLGVFTALCLCLFCGGASGVLILDPFQLHLLDSVFGRSDPLVRAIPDDVPLVVSADLKALVSSNSIGVFNAFAAASHADEMENPQAFLQKKIDPWLQDQFNLTFAEDFKPWLGQFVDLAFYAIGTVQEYSTLQPSAKIVLLVEIKDREKADAFIEKCMDTDARGMKVTWSESTYGDVTIHEIQPRNANGSVAYLARSGNILMWATDRDSLREAVDTQAGKKDSLAGAQWYKTLSSRLPGERALSIFASGNALQELGGLSVPGTSGLDASSLSQMGYLNAIQGMALSFAAVKQGLRMQEVTVYDEGKLTGDQKMMLSDAGTTNDIKRLPENTLAFVGGQHLGLGWKSARESLSQLLFEEDADQSMQMFEKELGFNPDEDLFPYLNGDWSIALVPDADSYFARQAGEELGFVVSMDTSDEEAVIRTVGKFNHAAETQGNTKIDSQSIAGIDAYKFGAGSAGRSVAIYGVGKGHLTIASSVSVFEDVNNGGPSIADAAQYKSAWSGMPSGFSAVLFLDLRGIVEKAQNQAFRKWYEENLKPVQTIVMGTRSYGNGVVANVLLIAIEK